MDASGPTPSALGFRMPAEWSRQRAVWLSWPHKLDTWPGKFGPIPAKFAEIAAVISRHEEVGINCAAALQAGALTLLRDAGAEVARIHLYDHPTNDTWCRDHGPIFVRHPETGEVAATDWRYNAWGGKYPPFDLDNRIPERIAAVRGYRRFAFDLILEGGSLDVNGVGDLLTTEACLLNPNRNPTRSRGEIETALREGLGVERIHWLADGIIGDDTDGHVDDLSRFFSPTGIVTCLEPNTADANHPILQDNFERLHGLRDGSGQPFEIRTLPMPEPCFHEDQQMPASYANFLIINDAVLMPTFRQADRDTEAAAVLAGCFPGRKVIPVDCLDLVWGLGTLHCISQQEPEGRVGGG
ncbi:MAG: agmatine deiminase family protein [Opitutaceae bacterium]